MYWFLGVGVVLLRISVWARCADWVRPCLLLACGFVCLAMRPVCGVLVLDVCLPDLLFCVLMCLGLWFVGVVCSYWLVMRGCWFIWCCLLI